MVVTTEPNGASLQNGPARTVEFNKPADSRSAARSGPQVSVRYYGISLEGAILALTTHVGAVVKIHVFERSYTLPIFPALEVQPRSAGFIEAKLGDGAITYRSFTF
jgi:hypothetical protein